MCVVGAFDPKGGLSCYECAEASDKLQNDRSGEILLYNKLPPHAVIAPAALIAANYGVLEVYKLLTGYKSGTEGRIFHSNFIDYDHHYFTGGTKQVDCPHCNA